MTTEFTGWGVTLVTCGFLVNMLISGVHSALGVVYVHWLQEFDEGKGFTSSIVSTRIALMYLLGPVTGHLMEVFGGGGVALVGGALVSTGYFIAFFAQSVEVLIVAVGVIGGFGCSFVYLPSISITARYFTKRRGVAIGIVTSGAGFGAFIFPPLFTYLAAEFGWRGALLITSGLTLHLCACGMVFGITERNTSCEQTLSVDIETHERGSECVVNKPTHMNIIKRCSRTLTSRASLVSAPMVLTLLVSKTFTALSYFVPALYIVDRAVSYGISLSEGSMFMSANGIGNIIGRLGSGALADQHFVDITVLYIVVLMVFGTSTCVSVLCKGSYTAHMTYAVTCGTAAGAWSTLLTPTIVELAGVER